MSILLFLLGLLSMAFGLACLLWPGMADISLRLETFWKTDGPPEPSDFYRFMTRISGVIYIVPGIFLFACVFS